MTHDARALRRVAHRRELGAEALAGSASFFLRHVSSARVLPVEEELMTEFDCSPRAACHVGAPTPAHRPERRAAAPCSSTAAPTGPVIDPALAAPRGRAGRAALCAAALVLPGCGKGLAGDAARPDERTGAEARGEKAPTFDCTAVAPAAEPLVVDWPDHERVDLAISLTQSNVAVVHYGCDGMRLLKHCRLDGTYRFAGSPMLVDVVALASADSVKASLPMQGARFAGEVSGNSQIDIATAIIGRFNTLTSGPSQTDLQGECDGATHFVRSAYVGAFTMTTGTRGKAEIAAEIFKAAASAGSTSDRSALTKDGELAVCQGFDPDDPKPPSKCRSAVRLELSPLAATANPPQPASDAPQALANVCVDGYVLADGKCTRKDSGEAYRCDREDFEDCKHQCDQGNADSCYNAALGPLSRKPIPPNHPEYAARRKAEIPFHEKACAGGVGLACNALGLTYDSRSAENNPGKATEYYEKACHQLFLGVACIHQGRRLMAGERVHKDPQAAVRLMTRACDLGDPSGCTQLGKWFIEGTPDLPKDPARGVSVLEVACNQARSWSACEDLSGYHADGKFLRKDPAAAGLFMRRACALGSRHKTCRSG